MKKFLLGTKQQMTQVFDNEGRVHAATILSVSPMTVLQLRDQEKDGYSAVQVGAGTRAKKNINKAARGHMKDMGDFATVKEFKVEKTEDFKVGDTIDAGVFEAGDEIEVSAVSKGKGFQGVVKRYDFRGQPKTHGTKHAVRQPGSIGSTGPQRVFKGTRMAGRMGADRVTVKNLKVLQVNPEKGILLVSGAVPGRRGTLVEVRSKA